MLRSNGMNRAAPNPGQSQKYDGAIAPVHLIVITHTAQHLETCLHACCLQSQPPDTLTVSCDVLSDEIAAVVERVAGSMSRRMTLVQRAHTGKARCAQVRNNAVRQLLHTAASPPRGSRLVFIDGDTAPRHDAMRMHAELGGGDRLVSAFRVNLSEEQTRDFEVTKIAQGRDPVVMSTEQARELQMRDARYRRQAFWRTLGLGKVHKPRLIGGHFSVPFEAYLEVNGCDEGYEGYGQEDDDLTRRLHQSGWKTRVGVKDIVVYHLWHPTRAPGNWHDAPGVRRFTSKAPTRAELGVDRPAQQSKVIVRDF